MRGDDGQPQSGLSARHRRVTDGGNENTLFAQHSRSLDGLRLVADHQRNDGAANRREDKTGGNEAVLDLVKNGLIPAGFVLPPVRSAIIPLVIGDEAKAVEAAAVLREQGVLIPAVRYPTV